MEIKANPIQKDNIKESDANTNQQQVVQQQKEQQQQSFNPQQQNFIHMQNKKLYKPEYIFCEDTQNQEKLLKAFPHLKSLKEAENTDFESIEDAKCFIIRSNNEDDIHKAIKYSVWCSTPPNNQMLNKAYQEAQEKDIPIYLFYSVVKSGQFVGIAKLKSGLQDKNFAFWWQHSKWRGCFDIEWVFIKDIVYKQFENLVNKEDKPVNRSKDGTEIDWKTTGLPMIQKYKEDKNAKSIFELFSRFDQAEQFQRWRYFPRNAQPQIDRHQQIQVQQQQNQQMMYYTQLAFQQLEQFKNQNQAQNGQQIYNPQYQQYQKFNYGYPQQQYYGQGPRQQGYRKPYNKKYNNRGRGGYNNYNNQNRQQQQGKPQQQQQQQQQQSPQQQDKE